MEIDWSLLEGAVADASQHGTVGVAVLGPAGERWSHHGDRAFRAASIVKVPLMIEIYRKIDRGELHLDELHPLQGPEKARGSGVMLHLHDGVQLSLRDLIYLMISISDNTATNLLIQRAGMDAVNQTMRELGMTNSNLGREMKGRPATPGETENWATPNDYVRVLTSILDTSAASPASCEAMIDMLEKQQNARRIARFLPEREDLRWGSKTGSITAVTNDVGFVETPRGRMVIAVLCEGMPDQHIGEASIGSITLAACDATGILA